MQLRPTLQTLSRQPFLFGERPTLADAALYGQLVMLQVADKDLPVELSPEWLPWMSRLEKYAAQRP